MVINSLGFPLRQSLSQPVWRPQFQWLCCFCACLRCQAGLTSSLPGGNTQPSSGKPCMSSWHCPERTLHLFHTPHLTSRLLSGASQISLSSYGPHLYLLVVYHISHNVFIGLSLFTKGRRENDLQISSAFGLNINFTKARGA